MKIKSNGREALAQSTRIGTFSTKSLEIAKNSSMEGAKETRITSSLTRNAWKFALNICPFTMK